eukprot:gene5999-13716_t
MRKAAHCAALCASALPASAAKCNPEADAQLSADGQFHAPATGAAAPLTLLPQDRGDDTKWTMSINGGGWCYDEIDCYCRSKGQLGTSKVLPKTMGCACMNPKEDGTMESDCNCIHM